MSGRPGSSTSTTDRVIRLSPYYYIHVLDNNENITSVEMGPKTFIRKDHETISLSPTPMVNIPPRHYCIVGNPCVRDKEGKPMFANGMAKLRHGESEVRLFSEWTTPFALYPGEFMQLDVTELQMVKPNTALRVSATRPFTDNVNGKAVERAPGDEWLFYGPATFIPRIEVKVWETVVDQIIKPNQALKLQANRAFTSSDGVARRAGEQWLIRKLGSYLPTVEEKVVSMVAATVLTEKRALHLRATHTFTDVYGKVRKAGQEWLITVDKSQTHIADIFEEVVGTVEMTTLGKQQYCVVVNPIGKDGNPVWGRQELRLGEAHFFLQPGEQLLSGIQDVHVLGEDEALLLRAKQELADDEGKRQPGDEWMIYGPRKYVPPVEVSILERRRRIPLDENEGIYVRDKKTGKVFTVQGQSYMLKPNEVLWNKELPKVVEGLLGQTGYRGTNAAPVKAKPRELHKVVTYRVPHNSAVQLYDYKKKESRVLFGPELVMLEPDEQFSIISLSGGNPKRADAITSLSLQLGPDFMNDVVVVETSDHARLKLSLSYNWHFEVDKANKAHHPMIFSVRDFVGDTCKAIASRVRGAVAAQTFDNFHKNSAEIIRSSVFGNQAADGTTKMKFHSNLLVVTNIDVQSVEPVEQRTRDALQKSVQLAIEISTASQEALANHEAAREEQVAEGKLQRKKIRDLTESETERMALVQAKMETAHARAVGQANAEAQAEAVGALAQAKTAVKLAERRAEAMRIRSEARLKQMKMKQEQEIKYQEGLDRLEMEKAEKQAQIEADKFAAIVKAIGADTIEAIARAGPEMQAKLLEGLGLQGFLVTDGNSPINLFNTANGLVGGGMGQ